MTAVRTHLRVEGRVQGVYFRASTQAEALRLGLVGWVRNRRDGTVEVVAEGPARSVETLVAWAQEGPPAARVDRLETATLAPLDDEGETSFAIRPTV
jgi:acylphosphatase